jgi:hypothetical protein
MLFPHLILSRHAWVFISLCFDELLRLVPQLFFRLAAIFLGRSDISLSRRLGRRFLALSYRGLYPSHSSPDFAWILSYFASASLTVVRMLHGDGCTVA